MDEALRQDRVAIEMTSTVQLLVAKVPRSALAEGAPEAPAVETQSSSKAAPETAAPAIFGALVDAASADAHFGDARRAPRELPPPPPPAVLQPKAAKLHSAAPTTDSVMGWDGAQPGADSEDVAIAAASPVEVRNALRRWKCGNARGL